MWEQAVYSVLEYDWQGQPCRVVYMGKIWTTPAVPQNPTVEWDKSRREIYIQGELFGGEA